MTDTPGTPGTPDRPRPSARPRPATGTRPSPRPRVAGSRRDAAGPRTGTDAASAAAPGSTVVDAPRPTARPRTRRGPAEAPGTSGAAGRKLPVLVLVLALLCVAFAVGGAVLLGERLNPKTVNPEIFAAARNGVEAVYAYDYKDSDGSVKGKLAVLTGDLHDQYEKDLQEAGVIASYEQVSATTSYQIRDVGLQQVNDAQDTATLVVFGTFVVKSVNTGDPDQATPQGCQVSPSGAQGCTQTVRVTVTKVDGDWKISELTLLTTS